MINKEVIEAHSSGSEPYICHKLPLVLLKYLSLQEQPNSVGGILDKLQDIELSHGVTLYKGNASMLCSDVKYLRHLGLLNVDWNKKREASTVVITGLGRIFSSPLQVPEYLQDDPNNPI